MALFSYESLRNSSTFAHESYDRLYESAKYFNASQVNLDERKFDIFLSHSYHDKAIIPPLKEELENFGFSVYVDWIVDKFLSREQVNKKTAEILQKRMKQSKCLVYATSQNSEDSKWMPWELGYFDGIKDKMVAILPIKKSTNDFQDNFKGREYLGLYHYIDKSITRGGDTKLFVLEDRQKYILLDQWLSGQMPFIR